MGEVETLLARRDDYIRSNDAKDILEKHKLQSKIDERIEFIKKQMSSIEAALKSQKKKKPVFFENFTFF